MLPKKVEYGRKRPCPGGKNSGSSKGGKKSPR